MKKKVCSIFLAIVVFVGTSFLSSVRGSGSKSFGFDDFNGFDLSYSRVPREEIFRGGPPKDGIPALTNPKVIPVSEADYLKDEDLVIGVEVGKESRAYPLRIMVWHENANDRLGGVPIAVSYCPLCYSSLVFDRRVGGQTREFGISGLLWNSNALLYDRQSRQEEESLWSQVLMRAVTGPAAKKGLRLRLIPSELVDWKTWKNEHPDGTVLSKKTGYYRNYDRMPYGSYFASDRLMFPVDRRTRREGLKNKEEMLLVKTDRAQKAYVLHDLKRLVVKGSNLKDRLGDKEIKLERVSSNGFRAYRLEEGKWVRTPSAVLFNFVLEAMYPVVEIFNRSGDPGKSYEQRESNESGWGSSSK